MLIGGAEDKLREKSILSRFVREAGGPQAYLVVISTASSLGDRVTRTYSELFEGLGAAHVEGLHPTDREQAQAPEAREAIARASGVFLAGGNQSRLVQVVAGTKIDHALHNAHDRGAVLAGTSAGASAMASHMVAYGRGGATPKSRMVQLSAGLGILQGMVVDQHFEERGRTGRLLALVAQSPSLLGLGIDEDTCATVHANGVLEVLGRGAVTIVDGNELTTDAHLPKGYKPLMVSGARLHSLPSGYRFDLRSRRLIEAPAGLEAELEASE
jgi:cyanophycinase